MQREDSRHNFYQQGTFYMGCKERLSFQIVLSGEDISVKHVHLPSFSVCVEYMTDFGLHSKPLSCLHPDLMNDSITEEFSPVGKMRHPFTLHFQFFIQQNLLSPSPVIIIFKYFLNVSPFFSASYLLLPDFRQFEFLVCLN